MGPCHNIHDVGLFCEDVKADTKCVLKKLLLKFCNIQRKAPVLESLFDHLSVSLFELQNVCTFKRNVLYVILMWTRVVCGSYSFFSFHLYILEIFEKLCKA